MFNKLPFFHFECFPEFEPPLALIASCTISHDIRLELRTSVDATQAY